MLVNVELKFMQFTVFPFTKDHLVSRCSLVLSKFWYHRNLWYKISRKVFTSFKGKRNHGNHKEAAGHTKVLARKWKTFMRILGESTSFSNQIFRSMQYIMNQQIMVTQFLTRHQNCKLKWFESDLLINKIWYWVICIEFSNLQPLSIKINLLIFKNIECSKDVVNRRIKALFFI